jgi:hypothetical protein
MEYTHGKFYFLIEFTTFCSLVKLLDYRLRNYIVACMSEYSRPVVGLTQPHLQWVLGALSPGVKRSGREADHSPPTSAEVKKT